MLPTPAVAYLADELGLVISASHNPPEYNGVKLFRDGGKLVDEQEEEVEGLLDASVTGGGSVEELDDGSDAYLARVIATVRLRISQASGSASTARTGPSRSSLRRVLRRSAPRCMRSASSPTARTSTRACGATDLAALQQLVTRESLDLGVAFDGDGDRMLAVDESGEVVDGDQILAILALALGVDIVAVTVMTNLGFHRLMAENGVRVVTTPVGDRYVSEALSPRRRASRRRAIGSRHLARKPRDG